MSNIRVASTQLKRIMKDNLFQRRVISSRGSIEGNRLAHYRTSRKIFSVPQEKGGKKYNIELLIDVSGSMFIRDRYAPAIRSAQNFVRLLMKYADVEVTLFDYLETRIPAKEVLNLNPDADWMETEHYCMVEDKVRTTGNGKELVKAERGGNKRFGGNWEMIGIHNAFERLLPKRGEKIIFILLDGSANLDDYGGEHPETLSDELFIYGKSVRKYNLSNYKEIVREVEKKGVHVVAFGIQTNSPSRFYDNFSYLGAPEDAFSEIVKQMDRIVRKKPCK